MKRPCSTLKDAVEGIGPDYPQCQVMSRGYDYGAPNSVHKLPFDSLPDFEPTFNTVIIEKSAVLTDLISTTPIMNIGLLMSGRFREILESFSLPEHRFYPVPMRHRCARFKLVPFPRIQLNKRIPNYWWLHLPQPDIVIPPNASSSQAEAIIEASASLAAVDLLRIYRPERFYNYFISAPLRKAIESANLTGIRFGHSRLFYP
jgi:hypothetical protein